MKRFSAWLRVFGVAGVLLATGFTVSAQPGAGSADATFKFIASQLQSFERTGQIDASLGLDGSEYEDWLELLRTTYAQFKRGFTADSALCRTYLDPENGRMEIEERAQLAISLLPTLEQRLRYYQDQDALFQEAVQTSFGGGLLSRIDAQKGAASNYEYLPSWNLNVEEAIHFADTACGA